MARLLLLLPLLLLSGWFTGAHATGHAAGKAVLPADNTRVSGKIIAETGSVVMVPAVLTPLGENTLFFFFDTMEEQSGSGPSLADNPVFSFTHNAPSFPISVAYRTRAYQLPVPKYLLIRALRI